MNMLSQIEQQTSYYQASANEYPLVNKLSQNYDVDVCIIGAGITGLSAAIECARQGLTTLVLEQGKIACAASGRSGGQMLLGYNVSQDLLQKKYGPEVATQLWNLAEESISLAESRIKKYDIQCDLKKGALYLAKNESEAAELKVQSEAYKRLGIESHLLSGSALDEHIDTPFYRHGLYENKSGHLHPLNYTYGLAHAALLEGVQIFHNSPVTGITDLKTGGYRLVSESYRIHTHKLILAGNAVIGNLIPGLAKSIIPITSYILATEPLAEDIIPGDAACSDEAVLLNYFRKSADNRLLFGGRPGAFYSSTEAANRILYQRMLQVFPQLKSVKVDWNWGGRVAITQPQIPQILQKSPNLWVAQGYSGHGMALAGMAGLLLAEAVAGNSLRMEPFKSVNHLKLPANPVMRSALGQLGILGLQLRERLDT